MFSSSLSQCDKLRTKSTLTSLHNYPVGRCPSFYRAISQFCKLYCAFRTQSMFYKARHFLQQVASEMYHHCFVKEKSLAAFPEVLVTISPHIWRVCSFRTKTYLFEYFYMCVTFWIESVSKPKKYISVFQSLDGEAKHHSFFKTLFQLFYQVILSVTHFLYWGG